MTDPTKARVRRGHRNAIVLALLPAAMPAAPGFAQSVPPAATSGSGGTLSSQAPVGVRSPKPQAAPAEALPGGRPGPPGLPQAIRWTEDWSAAPAPDAPVLERIRHIPIGAGDAYLSLGGEARAYYTRWTHQVLGLRADRNDPFVTRLRLLADLHVAPALRAFIEFGDNREFGAAVPTPPNRGTIDLAQAFVDVTVPIGDAGRLTLRPGRFEMPLGNGKLVSLRDGPNVRFTYQGLRAAYVLPGTLSIDAFAVRPIAGRPGSLDDRPNRAATFHGVYVSAPNRGLGLGTDLYWYEYRRDAVVLRQGTGTDRRNNWGGRLWKRTPTVDVDLEGNYQSGSFAGRKIRAYGVIFDGGYTLATAALKPRLGLRANLFSGDGNLRDDRAGTFVAAAPRLPLTSEATHFNFSNLMNLYPSLTLKPHDDVTIVTGPDFLWRHRRGDGVYAGPTGASFAPYAASRYIGTEFNLEAAWQVTKRLQLRVYETYLTAGDSFAANGGRSANYLGLQSYFRF